MKIKIIIVTIFIFFLSNFYLFANTEVGIKEEKQLKLILNSFVFNGNLEYALKTAEIGVKKYPDSLFWRKNLAKILVWSGKSLNAVDQYLVIYKRTKDKVLRDKLIELALDHYEFNLAIDLLKEKMKEDSFHDKKYLQDLIYLMNENSDPEDTLNFLSSVYKKNQKEFILKQALSLSIQSGDIEKASEIVSLLNEKKKLSIESVNLMAYFYFLKRDPNKAFKILTRVSDEKEKNADYYKKISDLGWYVGEYEKAADASFKLIKMNSGRELDYQRVIQSKKFISPEIAAQVAMMAMKKYNKKNFFYASAYIYTNQKNISGLKKLINSLDENMKKKLEKEAPFFLIMATYYENIHRLDLARASLFSASRIEPHNQSIIVSIIWFMMNNKMDSDLNHFIIKTDKLKNKRQELIMVLSSANFYLQNIDRAFSYLFKLKKNNTSEEIDLIYTYILQAKIRVGEYYQSAGKIYRNFIIEINKNPHLMKNKAFLDGFLSISLSFMNPDDFKDLLKKSKSVIGAKRYLEYNLLFALQNQDYEKASEIASSLDQIEGWQILSLALHDFDTEKIKDTIEEYNLTLPLRDRIDGAMKIMEYSNAESYVFDGLKKNSADYLIYYQMKQVYEQTGDRFHIGMDYIVKDSILDKKLNIDNKNHIGHGLYLKENLSVKSFQIKNNELYQNMDSSNYFFGIQLEKLIKRGKLSAGFELMQKKKSSLTKSFQIENKLGKRTNIKINFISDGEASENTYLEVAGKKDLISAGLSFKLLPSTSTGFTFTKENFRSDDNVNLGNSVKMRFDSFTALRTGYPDMNINFFLESGSFSEKTGNKGIIDEIRPFNGALLSDDYLNIGFGFFYGTQNMDTFVRDWRPYFGISPYYELKKQKFNLGVSAGIGGKFFMQDHLNFGFEYKPAVYATDEKNMTIYCNFSVLY